MFEESIAVINKGIGVAFPCAAVAVGVGYKVFAREFFGKRQIYPTELNITEDTLFDMASLSKLIATTMIALQFIEREKLFLDDSIGQYLEYSGNYSDCKIIHLLTHTSGMPAGLPLFDMQHKKDDVLLSILDSESHCVPGEQVIYSCMGFIVLQRILETIGENSLDKLAQEYVFSPLGMKNTCYNPCIYNDFLQVAATERYPHNGEWATGHVHDENSYFLGGISGNAGVFSTLDDMISFAGMCSSKGLTSDGKVYLSRGIFDMSVKNYTEDKKESRGLGFQLKGSQDFPGGRYLSKGSFGHTGFTGTSFYVDNETGLWGILLTNAVHYGRENRSEYFTLRRAFYDTMVKEYDELMKSGAL